MVSWCSNAEWLWWLQVVLVKYALMLDSGGRNMMLKVGLRKGQISMEDWMSSHGGKSGESIMMEEALLQNGSPILHFIFCLDFNLLLACLLFWTFLYSISVIVHAILLICWYLKKRGFEISYKQLKGLKYSHLTVSMEIFRISDAEVAVDVGGNVIMEYVLKPNIWIIVSVLKNFIKQSLFWTMI